MAKKRSPAYPAFDLGRAIARAKQIYADSHGGWASRDALASVFGLSPTSSSLRQTVSTMLQFELLEQRGTVEPRQLRLSSIGRNLVVREPESVEYVSALRHAALGPKLHKEIYERYSGILPPGNSALRSYLLVEREPSFHPEHVDAFIRQLRSSFELARVSGVEAVSLEDEADETERQGGHLDSHGQPVIPEHQVVVAQPVSAVVSEGRVAHAHYDEDSPSFSMALPRKNRIEIRLVKRVTPGEFEHIKNMLELARFAFVIGDGDE